MGTGLYDYGGGTRWYDPSLGRWTSPDSVVPLASQGVQALDRYAHSYGNPVKYIDPSGYVPLDFDTGGQDGGYGLDRIFDSGTGDKPPQPDAPPDFENPLPGGNPPPPHVDGLPDNEWEWGEWPGLGEG